MTQIPNWKKLRNGKLDWSVFQLRSKVLRVVREYFGEQNYMEIEAPLLTPFPTLDNHIESIHCDVETTGGRSHRLYLHTSPEHAMKKLLSAGSGSIYFLGKVFRDNETTRLHNSEFTMAEWYRIQADYHDIMHDTRTLICRIADRCFNSHIFRYQNTEIDLTPSWPVVSVSELFNSTYGLSPSELLSKESLKRTAEKYAIHTAPDDDWETLFHRLFLANIEPGLGIPQPVFVIDYPDKIGLMARHKSGDSGFVERVELYIAGLELANGYSELTDPEEQLHRFEQQKKRRKACEYYNDPVDRELIEAMKLGMPACAGIALGVDRLIMLFLNRSEIQDVILFPWHHME